MRMKSVEVIARCLAQWTVGEHSTCGEREGIFLHPQQSLRDFCPRSALHHKSGRVGGGGEHSTEERTKGGLPAATVLLFSYPPPAGALVKLKLQFTSNVVTTATICADLAVPADERFGSFK